jgi:hypothetical protein
VSSVATTSDLGNISSIFYLSVITEYLFFILKNVFGGVIGIGFGSHAILKWFVLPV